MFQALTNLFASLTRLSAAVNALAETAEKSNEAIRERIGYSEPEALEHKTRNGKAKV